MIIIGKDGPAVEAASQPNAALETNQDYLQRIALHTKVMREKHDDVMG